MDTIQETTPALKVENLNAWFGTKQVLFDINMALPVKQVTAIIGPSGCGKSTFIRCLNRLHEEIPEAQVEGSVVFQGDDIRSPSVNPVRLRSAIGMVFQKANPFPAMSIRDNVLAGLSLARRDLRDGDDIAEQLLTKVGLWTEVKDQLGKSGISLSGGQQQRLCIARALALEPAVLLMDEPCSALDPIATARVEDLIQEIGQHTTVVIVTHNMQQAARISHNTAFFYMGKLVEYNRTEVLFNNPQNQQTDDYITGRFG